MRTGGLRDPKLWIGLALSCVFLYLALRGMDAREVVGALDRADYRLLVPAFLLTYLVLWGRARRWGVLLRGVRRVDTWLLFRVTLIGFLANYLLPARAGEVVRALLLGKRGQLSASAAFGTVVVERVMDLLSILSIFSLVSFFAAVPHRDGQLEQLLRSTALLLMGVAAVLVVVLWLLKKRTQAMVRFVEGTLGRVSIRGSSGLGRAMVAFAQGISPARGGKEILEIVFWTAWLWLISAAIVVILAEAMGLGIPWSASWFVLVALGLGVSVPSAPGFVGTFHYAAMASLMLYGVERNQALSFAILLHALCVVPVLALGMPLLWMEGLSLRKMRRWPKDDA
ncbi:MAG: lysylphosphatidylglycerol synthase transmembrane domain-containing protein [Thermodesulfobacteriota bacterium]